MIKNIAISGGGTGGHVFPALALAEALKEKNKNIKIFWLGEKNSFEEKACKESNLNIVFQAILGGKLRRYFSFQNFWDIPKIFIAFLQSLYILKREKIDKVFSKGGYVALPVVLAAWVLRIPVIVHDSDAVPGLTTKISSKFAQSICLCFEGAKEYFSKNFWSKIHITGLPVRKEITEWVGKKIEAKTKIQKKYFSDVKNDMPIIFIMGGSQGALAINESIISLLPELCKKVFVIHLTGYGKKIEISLSTEIQEKYVSLEFISNPSDLAMLYAASDVIIMRSSSAILEASFFTKNLILVPLPGAAANHQEKNAKEFILKHPSATIVDQKQENFSEILKGKIFSGITQKPLMGIPKSIHKDDENAVKKIIQFLL